VTTPASDTSRFSLQNSRALRWALGLGVAAMAVIGMVLLFLLTLATNNRELYERNYGWLFIINMVVAGLLLLVIIWIMLRLYLRLRRGKFGSRLLVKLAAIFALVGFMPGVLIYVVSYQFVSRSIESWFDVKVEGALDAGLSLGRATLDTLANDLANKTRVAANQLSDVPDAAAGVTLERLRDQLAANDVILWSSTGQLLASAGQSRFLLNPEKPATQMVRNARTQRTTGNRPTQAACRSALQADAHVAPAARRFVRATQWLVGFLKRHDGVGAGRYRRPGHDPYRLARADRRLVDVSRREVRHHPELHRRARRRTCGIRGAYGVAIHRRVVQRRDVEGRHRVFCQHLSEGVQQRLAFHRQPVEERQDPLPRLVNTDHVRTRVHRFALVSRRFPSISNGWRLRDVSIRVQAATGRCSLPPRPASWSVSPRASGQPHRQAGRCPLHSRNLLHGFSYRVAEPVQVVRLELHDHVIWPCHRVNHDNSSARIREITDRRAHRFGLSNVRFNQHVATHGHGSFPPGQMMAAIIAHRAISTGPAYPAAGGSSNTTPISPCFAPSTTSIGAVTSIRPMKQSASAPVRQ